MGRNALSKLAVVLGLVCALSGCGPDYSVDTLAESLQQICLREYGLEVVAAVDGQTLAVYLPQPGLFNDLMMPSQEALLNINRVSFCASRVCFSVDKQMRFFVVICQDPGVPQLQIVTIRSVVDAKRSGFWMLSRTESYNRMIIDIKRTPQAAKEDVIRTLVQGAALDESWADMFIKEYVTDKPVLSIEDIGYWDKKFYIKDISWGEFLAKQVKQQLLRLFYGEQYRDRYGLQRIDCLYVPPGGVSKAAFRLTVELSPKMPDAGDFSAVTLGEAVAIAADVIGKYAYTEFDTFVITDSWNRKKVELAREDLAALYATTMSFGDLAVQDIY